MAETSIKNPFGDSITMSPSNEESDNNNFVLNQPNPIKNDGFQDEMFKNNHMNEFIAN